VLHFELGCFARWLVAGRSLEALWLTYRELGRFERERQSI
jgi:hypothetical protein